MGMPTNFQGYDPRMFMGGGGGAQWNPGTNQWGAREFSPAPQAIDMASRYGPIPQSGRPPMPSLMGRLGGGMQGAFGMGMSGVGMPQGARTEAGGGQPVGGMMPSMVDNILRRGRPMGAGQPMRTGQPVDMAMRYGGTGAGMPSGSFGRSEFDPATGRGRMRY